MSERAIPEILGWKAAPKGWGYEGGHWEHPTRGYVVDDRGGWSVDEMLAWLVDTGHVWSAQKFQTGVALTIAYIETGVEWIPPAFEAPTLHEALEAAVRAVAEVNS